MPSYLIVWDSASIGHPVVGKGDVDTPNEAIISDSPDKVIFLNASSSRVFINTVEHGKLLKEGEEMKEDLLSSMFCLHKRIST